MRRRNGEQNGGLKKCPPTTRLKTIRTTAEWGVRNGNHREKGGGADGLIEKPRGLLGVKARGGFSTEET